MKIRSIVVAVAMLLLLIAGNAWSGNGQEINSQINQSKVEARNEIKHEIKNEIKKIKHAKKGGHHKIPEIDATTGINALALLTGVLLLAVEIVWSRRT